MKRIFNQYEYKVLYKRILFTCFILGIYILGSNIPIVAQSSEREETRSFYSIAISNMGGDITSLNIFTLGLGPWLTSMIFFTLIAYRNMDKAAKQTKKEKHYKEKLLTLVLAVLQGYFVILSFVENKLIQTDNIYILVLYLVTGTMLLVWMADQNTRYGIAGPMPIVLMSIIKSMFQQQLVHVSASTTILVIFSILIIIVLFILLFTELVEYRTPYRDTMNVSQTHSKTYLAWKINPSGSISIMISVSVFILLNNLIHLILSYFSSDGRVNFQLVSFTNPIGITIYILIQLVLGYLLSRFLLNTKQKSKEFLKNGNYFVGVKPGLETKRYLDRMARRVCWFGSGLVTLIIAIPLYSTLLIPELAQQIYFAIQLIVLVYIGINIVETLRTYLYFDKYKPFLNKYW